MHSCLMLVFIINLTICTAFELNDDQFFIISTEVLDYTRLTNGSASSQTNNGALSLHFKLPWTSCQLTGKYLKEAELRIPSLLLPDDVTSLNSECNTKGDGSLFQVKLSKQSKCLNSGSNFQNLPVGYSRNCTDDNICIDISRIINYLESCNDSVYLDLTSCVNNDNILESIRMKRYLNLTVLYSGKIALNIYF